MKMSHSQGQLVAHGESRDHWNFSRRQHKTHFITHTSFAGGNSGAMTNNNVGWSPHMELRPKDRPQQQVFLYEAFIRRQAGGRNQEVNPSRRRDAIATELGYLEDYLAHPRGTGLMTKVMRAWT
ncbi:hypothetical protein MRX96_014045 [Rhipicephalus microplus]